MNTQAIEELDALYMRVHNAFQQAPQTDADRAIEALLELNKRLIGVVSDQQKQITQLESNVALLAHDAGY